MGFITNTHSVTVQTFTLQCFIAMINTFISHWFQFRLFQCFAFYTLHCNKTKLYRHFRFYIFYYFCLRKIFNIIHFDPRFFHSSHEWKTVILFTMYDTTQILRFLYAIYILIYVIAQNDDAFTNHFFWTSPSQNTPF